MEESKERISILYVDDEEHNLTSFKASFRHKFRIYTAISAKAAREILEKKPVEIIITDQRMPEETGVQFLQSIIPIYPEPIRMLLTGYSDIEAVIDSINKGQVFKYITKPWNDQELEININNAYEVFRLRKENKELVERLRKANEQLEFYLRQKLLE